MNRLRADSRLVKLPFLAAGLAVGFLDSRRDVRSRFNRKNRRQAFPAVSVRARTPSTRMEDLRRNLPKRTVFGSRPLRAKPAFIIAGDYVKWPANLRFYSEPARKPAAFRIPAYVYCMDEAPAFEPIYFHGRNIIIMGDTQRRKCPLYPEHLV